MISIVRYSPLLLTLIEAQIIPFNQPLPVLTSPVVQAKAGETLNYQLVNFRNKTCLATLTFHNDTFLPLSALARPRDCAGDQVARFQIPRSAPNGAAAMEWKCSGVDGTAIDIMLISGGTGDLEGFAREGEGVCVEVLCRSKFTYVDSKHQNVTCAVK